MKITAIGAVILAALAIVALQVWRARETKMCVELERTGEFVGVKPGPVGAIIVPDEKCQSGMEWEVLR